MDPDLAHRYDFDVRKCVHVRLFTQTKNELDIMKKRLDLPLQDIFECLSKAIIDQDPYIITMLNEYRLKKERRDTEKMFTKTDADSIMKAIEQNDPFQNLDPIKKDEDVDNS